MECGAKSRLYIVNFSMKRLMKWLYNFTINDISVIYMTAHRCAGGLKKTLDLWSGSQHNRHFIGFFNVPVQVPTRDHPFIRLFRENAQFSHSPFSIRWGYGGHILDVTPGSSRGNLVLCHFLSFTPQNTKPHFMYISRKETLLRHLDKEQEAQKATPHITHLSTICATFLTYPTGRTFLFTDLPEKHTLGRRC